MLTPLDIENKRFSKTLKGYNVDEVDDFLDELTIDYEKLYKENAELREQIEENKKDLEHYKSVEHTLQNTLVMAQTTADDIKANAQTRAEQIVRDAQSEARRATEEITKEESQQLELQFKEETEETNPVTTEEVQEEETEEEEEKDEFNFGDDESFSDILDEFSSSKSIRDKLNPDDARRFDKMLNNGLINITCK